MDPAVLLQHRSQPVILTILGFVFFFCWYLRADFSMTCWDSSENPHLPSDSSIHTWLPWQQQQLCLHVQGRIMQDPQNLVAADLVAVQHLTNVRKNALCQALLFALQQCREERGAVAGQDVVFRWKSRSFIWVLVVISVFDPRGADQTEHGTWFVWSDPVYWAIEGSVGVYGVLWLGDFIQRGKI